MRGIERFWKQFTNLEDFAFAFEICHDNGNVAAKFPDQLAARTARRCQRLCIRDHRDGVEAALPFADGFEYGDALGANGEAVRSVLDVAAAKNPAGWGQKRRATPTIRALLERDDPRPIYTPIPRA